MNKKFFLFFLICLISISSVIAVPPWQGSEKFTEGFVIDLPIREIAKQGEDLDFVFHVYNISNGVLMWNNTISCTGHLFYANGSAVGDSLELRGHENHFHFTLAGDNLSMIERYGWSMHCNNSVLGGFLSGSFDVTSTGENGINILDNPIVLYLIFLGFILLMLGVFTEQEWLGFLGSILLFVSGIYLMIYGLNTVVNLYTRIVGIVLIGIGVVFMIISSYENLWRKQ